MLGISRETLAGLAEVSEATLAAFESGRRAPLPRTLSVIRRALEDAGIEFFSDENQGRPGVRMANRTNPP